MDAGAEVFDYGNSIRGEAKPAGYRRAFDFPGFVPAYIRPLFCEGKGPFRWAALSGDPEDIAATDAAVLDLFPDNEPLARWIRMAREKVHFQGLPGPDLLARLRRAETWPGSASTSWSAAARSARRSCSAATIWTAGRSPRRTGRPRPWRRLGRDRGLADPERAGQHRVGRVVGRVHHGGGVGIGRSIHAGQVCVADGTTWPRPGSNGS